jgi:hypothetical protein
VLVSSRGEVAFTTSKGLRLALAGRRARLVARDDGSSVVLDDDRTLRWLSERDGTVRFIDLPRPGLDGCAPRSGFVAAVRTPDIAVTVGDFLGTKADEPGAVVTRACLLASATDPVIAQGVRTTGRDEDLRSGRRGPHLGRLRPLRRADVEDRPGDPRRARPPDRAAGRGPRGAPAGRSRARARRPRPWP